MNFLVNLIPATARKWVYGILTAAVFVYGVYEATAGDWTQFVVSLVTSIVTALATANTVPTGSEAIKTAPTSGD